MHLSEFVVVKQAGAEDARASANGTRIGNDFRLRPSAPQEKFDGIAHPLGEFVRAGKVHGPLADDGIEKSFHEFGEVHDRKISGDFAVFLALGDNFAQQVYGCGFGATQLGRAHRIHRAGENYGLPEWAADFSDISESFVKAAEALFGGGFGGELGFEAFGLAGESAASYFAQYRFFAGEIAEECGLADFQGLHNVVNACFFITALAKKMQGRFDDLLPEAGFLAFAKAADRFFSGSRAAACPGGVAVAITVDYGFRRGWLPDGSFCAGHDAFPPTERTGVGCGSYIVLVALTL
jgi:hypothetical protein